MQLGLVALGWYVRFVPVSLMDAMDDFYAEVLRLPRLWASRTAEGQPENKDLYWGGEAIVENHNYGGRDAAVDVREGDPGRARQVQIFRVTALAAALDALRGEGVHVEGPYDCAHGQEAFVLDPMGMLVGLRESAADSRLPEDLEATRRRLRGEAFNPGCGPMPRNWQEIGWIRIRAENLATLRAFYEMTLGLRLLRSEQSVVSFDLGDNTILEIAAGGIVRPAPPRQMSSLAAMIWRVQNTLDAAAALKSAGVHLVHDLIQIPKGNLSYFADPEGNVIGISDRFHPGTYVGPRPVVLPPVSLEDAEAWRRWVEAQARVRVLPTQSTSSSVATYRMLARPE